MAQLSFLDDRNVVGQFRRAYATSQERSWATPIAVQLDSDKETEAYRWLGAAPPLREWRGHRLLVPPGRYTTSISNVKYEASMQFDVDDIRRTAKAGNQIPLVIQEMAAKAAMHPEVLLTTLIQDADTTTSGLAYDGQQMVDTDHSEGASGTQINDLSVTQLPAADVVTTTAPTPTEWANVLMQALGWQYTYLDDQADPTNQDAREFMVMVGTPSLFAGLVQAINVNMLANGSNNPLQGLTSQKNITITPVLNTRRSAATAEFDMFRVDGPKAFIHQTEVPLQTQSITVGSELEFTEDAHRFGVKVVEGAGYLYWQSMMEITFS